MECYICGHDTKVVNSRHQSRLNQVWRRRVCLNCDYILTTIEKIDLERAMMIKFDNESIAPFIKEKLLISIDNSLGHRANHINEAISLTNTIVTKLQASYKTPLITKNDIVTTAQEVLKNFDSVASVYYNAYHEVNTK